MTSQQAFQMML
ncbi:hypothetical protein YPPY52_1631, partial [Yersinia pestis PY-52]